MENNNKLSNIIGVIISLLIIGIIAFFVYKNFIQIGNNRNSNINTNNNSVSNDSESEEKKIEKIGKEKFSMLVSKNNYLKNDNIFFKDNDVNIDNIDNKDVLSILYSFLSNEDKNKTGTYSENCFLNKGIYTKDNYSNCPKETFDKSILEEQYNNNFDNNLKVNYVDFYSSSTQQCFLSDNTYNCYLNNASASIPNYRTVTTFDSAKLDGDKLEVYSYLLTIRTVAYSNYQLGIYSNASATNRIDDLPSNVGNSISNELRDELVSKYKDKITKYKSTFIKSNKKYLWHSTEIVK